MHTNSENVTQKAACRLLLLVAIKTVVQWILSAMDRLCQGVSTLSDIDFSLETSSQTTTLTRLKCFLPAKVCKRGFHFWLEQFYSLSLSLSLSPSPSISPLIPHSLTPSPFWFRTAPDSSPDNNIRVSIAVVVVILVVAVVVIATVVIIVLFVKKRKTGEFKPKMWEIRIFIKVCLWIY